MKEQTYTVKLSGRDNEGSTVTKTMTIIVKGFDRQYYLTDHLGSIRTTVDGSGMNMGSVSSWDDYYPNGLPMPDRSFNYSNPQALNKFTGHEHDVQNSINLTYAGARYLDPEIGQWLSVDPLAAKFPEWSPYNYTMGNPIIYVDPDGREIVLGNWFDRLASMIGYKTQNMKTLDKVANILRSTNTGSQLWDFLDKQEGEFNIVLVTNLKRDDGQDLSGKTFPDYDEFGNVSALIKLDKDHPTEHADNILMGLTDDESRATTMGHELNHAKDAVTLPIKEYNEDAKDGSGEDRAEKAGEKIREEIKQEKDK